MTERESLSSPPWELKSERVQQELEGLRLWCPTQGANAGLEMHASFGGLGETFAFLAEVVALAERAGPGGSPLPGLQLAQIGRAVSLHLLHPLGHGVGEEQLTFAARVETLPRAREARNLSGAGEPAEEGGAVAEEGR